MTEQEIIAYLKENKNKGTVFAFMPSEVQEWCRKHCNEEIFYIFGDDNRWPTYKATINCYSHNVYSLAEDYESKAEFKPHWEEFDINSDGYFIEEESNEWRQPPVEFKWWKWQNFLTKHSDKYNAFGGWLFNDNIWCTDPQIINEEDVACVYDFASKDDICKPAIPTRIRFWRYKE